MTEMRVNETQEDLTNRTGTSTSADRPKKPAVTRRMSSTRRIPHKGQQFSADDGLNEVEEDAAQYAPISQASPRIRPPARSPNLQRRPSARPTPVTRADWENASMENLDLPNPGLDASIPSLRESQGGSDRGDGDEDEDDAHEVDDEDDDSDAASFTLKDRQQAINDTHPFGLRIWKPALYKKNRSVEKTAEGDIHSSPGAPGSRRVSSSPIPPVLSPMEECSRGSPDILLYPFGSFVLLETDDAYAEEDEGEGRSIGEYERWQNGEDLEEGVTRLFFGPEICSVGRNEAGGMTRNRAPPKRRLFGRGEWTSGRVVFFIFFYFLVGPLMLLVSLVCWLLVFWIPMGRVTLILASHLRRHPLALSFHSDTSYARLSTGFSSPSILLCTYRAAGSRYWKYTIDGTNIFFINLLSVVVFVIADFHILDRLLGVQSWVTHPGLIFTLSLFSIIPLAYFIGQAVASISAQSSMGLGAAINAFFSTIVEVYLYCVALTEGKAQLVEGSLIGSIFAGILFLPGLSMCFGAIKRKTQRFNVKSAGVTSTMLLFAVIAAFGPTLFYQVFGSHEINCHACNGVFDIGEDRDCRQCFFTQSAAIQDTFFQKAVQPYAWIAANMMRKKPIQDSIHSAVLPEASGAIRDAHSYKRVYNKSLQHLKSDARRANNAERAEDELRSHTPHLVPPSTNWDGRTNATSTPGLNEEQTDGLAPHLAAAEVAAGTIRDNARNRKLSGQQTIGRHAGRTAAAQAVQSGEESGDLGVPVEPAQSSGGHDAPNWSKTKSSVILLGATILYAIIAEILVDTVDVVLESVDVDEKFLGITLFALVPNTTEFLNAISFAMNGNIALSMEVGSAYALQVCMLQVPALVLFSAYYSSSVDPTELASHSFNLIFPQWDMITVILCIFLLSNVHGEGKSNYFKGSVLVLTYLFVVIGFYLSGYSNMNSMGVNRFDTLALDANRSQKFYTIGRAGSGAAY
ncbi:hypothetical protein N7470_010264 [Penicillium chermesinum]|nr:hypothetical protein N7470_010264 [Penicillium chermesinum]